MPDTNQPPFMPPRFPSGPPTAAAGVYEDGPGLFTNPANSAQAVRYNGQNQTSVINSKVPWASIPWEDGPNGMGPGGVIVPVAGQSARAPLGTQGAPPLPTVGVQRWLSSADYLGIDGNVYLYDRVTGAAYKET